MAKRKKSAALFEVIHADKRFAPRTGGWSLSAPRWLFGGGKATSDETTASEPACPSRLWSFIPSFPRLGFTHDPDRQLLSFQLSYTTAGVCVFTMIVVLALTYVIGKHNGHRPLPALADSTSDELRNGPSHPEVLNIPGDGPDVAMAVAPLSTGGPAPGGGEARSPGAAGQGARSTTWNEPKPPTTLMEVNEKRTTGMQYVLVQSYPPEEKAIAEQTVKLLNSNGILCTLETGLTYAPRWHCIVGVAGFTRVRNAPEYDAYIAKINEVGAKLGSQQKFFKKFENKPIRWHEGKSQGNG